MHLRDGGYNWPYIRALLATPVEALSDAQREALLELYLSLDTTEDMEIFIGCAYVDVITRREGARIEERRLELSDTFNYIAVRGCMEYGLLSLEGYAGNTACLTAAQLRDRQVRMMLAMYLNNEHPDFLVPVDWMERVTTPENPWYPETPYVPGQNWTPVYIRPEYGGYIMYCATGYPNSIQTDALGNPTNGSVSWVLAGCNLSPAEIVALKDKNTNLTFNHLRPGESRTQFFANGSGAIIIGELLSKVAGAAGTLISVGDGVISIGQNLNNQQLIDRTQDVNTHLLAYSKLGCDVDLLIANGGAMIIEPSYGREYFLNTAGFLRDNPHISEAELQNAVLSYVNITMVEEKHLSNPVYNVYEQYGEYLQAEPSEKGRAAFRLELLGTYRRQHPEFDGLEIEAENAFNNLSVDELRELERLTYDS